MSLHHFIIDLFHVILALIIHKFVFSHFHLYDGKNVAAVHLREISNSVHDGG